MENIRILIVEDDDEINNLVHKALSREGYEVTQVFNGIDALKKWQQEEYEIVLLDIMLPGIDGIEVMRRIREKSTVPILIMSAKGEETDRVIGLGLGADDYIVKPFYVSELVARVKAHIRRSMYFSESKKEDKVITYGNISFDIDKYTVVKRGDFINLTAKEIEILKLFFQNPKKVFTKVQIFNSVWGEEFVGDDNTVMVHIRRLRNKIEDDPNNPKYILTVWGIGYRLGEF